MNLEDLRNHLADQAGEVDPTTPVPLPTIRRRRTSLIRRRASAAIAATAAAVVLIAVVLPNAINTSTPPPAETPADYTRDGITIPGTVGGDRLDKAEIAKPGANTLEFSWTPNSTNLTLRSYCQTKVKDRIVRVTVDSYMVLDQSCDDTGGSPRHAETLPPDHVLWLQLKPGRPTTVQVFVMDRKTGQEDRSVTGLGLGIYRSPAQPKDPAVAGLPVRSRPADPDDYTKYGFRFPARLAGDRLVGAAVGALGQGTLTARFAPTTDVTSLRPYCLAVAVSDSISLKVSVNGRPLAPVKCTARRGDLTQGQADVRKLTARPNHLVEVTMEVVQNATGQPFASVPGLHIGYTAYSPGKQRTIETSDGSTAIDEVIEYRGYRYQLSNVQTTAAAGGDKISLDTPAGKPYVIAYGGANLGTASAEAKVLGLTQELAFQLGDKLPEGGPGRTGATYGQPAGRSGKVKLKIVSGQPTQGMLYLAIYLPE